MELAMEFCCKLELEYVCLGLNLECNGLILNIYEMVSIWNWKLAYEWVWFGLWFRMEFWNRNGNWINVCNEWLMYGIVWLMELNHGNDWNLSWDLKLKFECYMNIWIFMSLKIGLCRDVFVSHDYAKFKMVNTCEWFRMEWIQLSVALPFCSCYIGTWK